MKARVYAGTTPCVRGHVGERYEADGACVECARARARQRYRSNREALSAQARAAYRANPEPAKARARQQKAADAERAKRERRLEYQRHSEAYKQRAAAWARENYARKVEKARDWRRRNPDRVAHYIALKRASIAQRTPPWLTREQRRQIRAFYSEAKRRSAVTGILFEVDHIVPLNGETVSGLHVPWNLQLLSRADNKAKSNSFACV